MFFNNLPILQFCLLLLQGTTFATLTSLQSCTNCSCITAANLSAKLSSGASCVFSTSAAPRWSEFDAPDPGLVVNVATESDVLVTVQYCNENNISFLAQNGGHGWGQTFHLGLEGLIINLAGLNSTTFNEAKTEATIQGGALVRAVTDAAYSNGVMIPTGNCNCVGALGAILGGGFGRLQGLYGLGVDNLLSLNVVIANGTQITVTNETETDLWWALRGAGPNFGIVTSAVTTSYPVSTAENGAWVGSWVFAETQIEDVVEAISALDLLPEMAVFLYYAVSDGTPAVLVSGSYAGANNSDGPNAFATITALGPEVEQAAWEPFDEVNASGDSFCVKGGYKPAYGAGLAQLVPATWRSIWNEFVDFVAINGTSESSVMVDCYPMEKARSLPDSSSSYPWRSTISCNAAAIPWYDDASLNAAAVSFGKTVRSLWYETAGTPTDATYINYAVGDESNSVVYGDNLATLQSLKSTWDPLGKFDQFFPL
ncbi:FAD-linked oxidoreductase [Lachnellula occidentalis]|uniref:FAD-linked oxidoreductase n=1 Tax=Lachnellula occidentalis TaxID=215460 RepID=A0A8H8S527_9HELO|nr:FAD-linked oxidoreductase [Lachnellula occidentalis]